MRPKSIRLFEILYIASTLLGVIGPILAFAYPDMTMLNRAGMSFGVYLTIGVALILLVAFAVPLWLYQLAIRQRVSWAYWAILVVGAICAARLVLLLLQFQHAMSSGTEVPWPYGIAMPLGLLAAFVHMGALGLLFTSEARAWLRAKPAPETADEAEPAA